jgi:hypothetical protein
MEERHALLLMRERVRQEGQGPLEDGALRVREPQDVEETENYG